MKDKIKLIPALLSLLAGFITAIISIISRYDSLHIMIMILSAIFIFYIVGVVIKSIAQRRFVIEEVLEEENGEEAAEGEERPENGDGTEEPAEGEAYGN